ncbi:shikimate kinase [Jeotgalicoccus huakuii]|nr:shikimate kinase [Jeotgalicoccus huakuii]
MILIGFMGSGKTTIGNALAYTLKKELVDLDDVIPELANKSIPEIFKESGEKTFREYEYKALSLNLKEDIILSTGGGIVSFDQSFELLKKQNNLKVFFLNAPFDDMYERIYNDKTRPLGNQDKEKVKALYESRLDKYRALCDHEISTDKSIDETVDNILANLY